MNGAGAAAGRPTEQARLLAAIVDSSDDAIIGKTPDGIITSWNKGAERIYGYAATETIGQSVGLLVPPDRVDEVPGLLARICNGERVAHYETERRRKDGRLIFVSVSISPIQDETGVLLGAATITRDITERRLLEETVRENVRLESANNMLKSFSHAIAHELRNPMTIVAGLSGVLQEGEGGKFDALATECLGKIKSAVGRMTGIIDDLQNLSDVSRPAIFFEPTDLSSMAQDIVSQLRKAAPERRVEIRIAEGLTARCDPGIIRLALGNLLRNAWKFTAKADNPFIEFGMVQRDGSSAYFVKDNGAGFEMAEADKLFQPFSRLHGSNEFVGTGIGLTIVEKAVRRHNGRVWAESKVGHGATFYFTLAAGRSTL